MTLIKQIQSYFFADDQKVRESYNNAVQELYRDKYEAIFAEFSQAQQCVGEQIVRDVISDRAEIKESHQAQTSYLGQAAIYARNVWTYGNTQGAQTYEGLIAKGKHPEYVAFSAFKTDGKDLGLNGNDVGAAIDACQKNSMNFFDCMVEEMHIVGDVLDQ